MGESPSEVRLHGYPGGKLETPGNRTAPAGNRGLTIDCVGVKMATDKPTPNPTTAERVRIRKVATGWQVECPCGYRWDTHHHRLAIMFATEHVHWNTGPACLDHFLDNMRGCPWCGACPCNFQDGQCRYCRHQVA